MYVPVRGVLQKKWNLGNVFALRFYSDPHYVDILVAKVSKNECS